MRYDTGSAKRHRTVADFATGKPGGDGDTSSGIDQPVFACEHPWSAAGYLRHCGARPMTRYKYGATTYYGSRLALGLCLSDVLYFGGGTVVGDS
jgi:hypothetical protein